MSDKLSTLLLDIKHSRQEMIKLVSGITNEQSSIRVQNATWSIQEIVEHLVLAERGGFDLIYTAAEQFRNGTPVWTGPSKNDGLPIEQIIANTWKKKEKAPPSATPQGNYSLGVWLSHFKNCDDLLQHLIPVLDGLPLQDVIYPHFLCGPLNAIQRLEFIRFHIDRHAKQISNLKSTL